MRLQRQVEAASGYTVNGDDPGVQSPDRGMTPPDFGTAHRPVGGRPRHRPAKRSIRRLPARSSVGAAIRRAVAALLAGATANAQTVVFEATLTVGAGGNSYKDGPRGARTTSARGNSRTRERHFG